MELTDFNIDSASRIISNVLIEIQDKHSRDSYELKRENERIDKHLNEAMKLLQDVRSSLGQVEFSLNNSIEPEDALTKIEIIKEDITAFIDESLPF